MSDPPFLFGDSNPKEDEHVRAQARASFARLRPEVRAVWSKIVAGVGPAGIKRELDMGDADFARCRQELFDALGVQSYAAAIRIGIYAELGE